MKNKDIAGKRIRTLVSTVGYGLRMAWMASPFYTAVRITGGILTVIFAIGIAILGKDVLDFVTMNIATNESVLFVVGKLILIVVCKVLIDVNLHLMQWIQVRHEKLMESTGDSFIFSRVSWNCITLVGAFVGVLIAFGLLSGSCLLNSFVILCVSVPAAIFYVRNMKQLYRMQIKRSEHYIKKIREKSLRVGVVRKLSKLVLFFMALCLVFEKMKGTSTVGDLFFYIGLAEQLRIWIFILTQASISIIGYRLKMSAMD